MMGYIAKDVEDILGFDLHGDTLAEMKLVDVDPGVWFIPSEFSKAIYAKTKYLYISDLVEGRLIIHNTDRNNNLSQTNALYDFNPNKLVKYFSLYQMAKVARKLRNYIEPITKKQVWYE